MRLRRGRDLFRDIVATVILSTIRRGFFRVVKVLAFIFVDFESAYIIARLA